VTVLVYVDASALVKLVIAEADSVEMLHWYLESEQVITSRIGLVETERAVARRDHDPERLSAVLDRIAVFELDEDVGRRAGLLSPLSLRTLDAIHVATALAINAVDAFVTYDDRQAEVARAVGLRVIRPA
jgi:predicted nucleic acid-binding protein